MKKSVAIFIAVTFLASLTVMGLDVKASHARSMVIADAKNTICPVAGIKIAERKHSCIYDGKRYWFSSFKAVQDFKKSPTRYVGGASSSWQGDYGSKSSTKKKSSW
ncbi:MAG: hypothetical protein WC592_06445 [Candidatus Omnitrophota bacterium]|nr:hypothetical protein [Candidatus Omnitrophota bacterium]